MHPFEALSPGLLWGATCSPGAQLTLWRTCSDLGCFHQYPVCQVFCHWVSSSEQLYNTVSGHWFANALRYSIHSAQKNNVLRSSQGPVSSSSCQTQTAPLYPKFPCRSHCLVFPWEEKLLITHFLVEIITGAF